MKYSYYPGCTLRTKAKDLDAYARASAKALGFELEEIENWQCCGGYISLKEKEMSGCMSCNIVDSAAGAGAEMLITACPLCMYNLNKSGSGKIPVYYFTELLAEALGVKEEALK